MGALIETVEAAFRAVASDPRSDVTAQTIAAMVQAIDAFLTSPPFTLLHQLEPEARLAARHAMAGEVRRLIEGIRNMLSVAAQVEQYGGPVSWGPPLAAAIRRLEAEFHDIPDLSRQSPPPIVLPTEGPPETWRVEQPRQVKEPTAVNSPASLGAQPPRPGDESSTSGISDGAPAVSVVSVVSVMQRSLRPALLSCVGASGLCSAMTTLVILEQFGFCRLVHPLFWVPLALASFGVAGSAYMTVSANTR